MSNKIAGESGRCLIATAHRETHQVLVNALGPDSRIVWVRDGVNAWRRFHTQAFDLVVLDDALPRFLGLELLWVYRGLGFLSEPVIFLGEERLHQEARVAYADVCLTRPLDEDLVDDALVQVGWEPQLAKSEA